MNIFDKYIKQTIDCLQAEEVVNLGQSKQSNLPKEQNNKKRLMNFFKLAQTDHTDKAGQVWEIVDRNPYLMDRDTAIELGGYPKDSVNMILSSVNMDALVCEKEGVYCIGDSSLLTSDAKHVSFGKIVLLETEEIPEGEFYDFTQKELLTDSRIRMKDVMLRQSPAHYNVNLKIGKKAIAGGFNAFVMGATILSEFKKMPYVKSVRVILIIGESELYGKLLDIVQRVKEVTLTLNHIFDGIDMDCGHCDLSEICSEVEGMRELHRNHTAKTNN